MSTSNKERPFGFRDKIGYMFGDLGNDFTFIFASSFFMVFYTKVMGISMGMVGTLFLVARCVDAFTDIGMGRLVDSAKMAKDGRFRCWIRRMCGPVALTSFLMYQSALADASMTIKTIYMFITYILWGSVFYTSINIPYGSMASAISNESKERVSLSTFRSLGAGFAGILIMVVTPAVIYYENEAGDQVVDGGRFTMLAGVFSVCAIICYLICYFSVTERVKIEPKEGQKVSLTDTFKTIFSSRSVFSIILASILLLLASLMSQGVNNYLYADYFKNTGALSISGVITLPVMLVMAAIVGKLSSRFGKREAAAVGCLFAGAVYLVMYVMHLKNVWVFLGFYTVAMIGYYYFQMVTYAMITDVIDDKEVVSGVRDDGTVYGVYSFARKIGQALAGGLSGYAMQLIGYDSLATGQTEAVRNGIYGIATLFPGVVYLLVGIVLWFLYPLSKIVVENNVLELRSRHQKTK